MNTRLKLSLAIFTISLLSVSITLYLLETQRGRELNPVTNWFIIHNLAFLIPLFAFSHSYITIYIAEKVQANIKIISLVFLVTYSIDVTNNFLFLLHSIQF